MPIHTTDVFIIGQGLAGSVLACELLQRNQTVILLDDGREGSASHVAAGMFNPMSFRRIIPVWRADEVMAALQRFYPRQETFLNAQFYHQVPLVKLFPNGDYAELWQRRINEGISWVSHPHALPEGVSAPFGAGCVLAAGYVDLPVFLNALRSRLSADGRFIQLTFSESNLSVGGNGVVYRDAENDVVIQAKSVVIATGVFAQNLKLTANLPLHSNKGEVLTVKIQGFESEVTLNNGKWLLPLGKHRFRLGASYEPGAIDTAITPSVREHLINKASEMIEHTFELESHRAGLRPTVKDRRPLIGQSSMPRVYHFNGLGTRGVLNAPYLAAHFCDHLLHQKPLDHELDLARFDD